MTTRQKRLFEFVKIGHFGVPRKYIQEPYHMHVLRVGLNAEKEGIPFGLEIGIGHDLFEDTKIQEELLRMFLLAIDYLQDEVDIIISGINHLTDEFIKEKYPHLSRRQRKILEVERLQQIPSDIQSIKYIDCIDNGESIFEHDKNFAITYLREILSLLSVMNQGKQELFNQCQQMMITNMSLLSEEGITEW